VDQWKGYLWKLDETKQGQGKHSSIFSDSKSVLETLCSISPFEQCNPLIFNIKEELLLLEEASKTVHFYWIPAHIGITRESRHRGKGERSHRNRFQTPPTLD
jgi:hypothetical protein